MGFIAHRGFESLSLRHIYIVVVIFLELAHCFIDKELIEIDNTAPFDLGSKVKTEYAHVAQLDRVPGYEPGGRRFDSFHARHISKG